MANKYDHITPDELKKLAGVMTRTQIATHYSVDPRIIGRLLVKFDISAQPYTQSEQTRTKRAATLKQVWEENPDIRIKMTATLTDSNLERVGKTYEEIFGSAKADAIQQKQSTAHTGSKQSAHTRAKRSESLKGRTHTDTALQKLSETRKEGFRNGKIKLSPKAGNGRGGFKEDIGHYVRSSYEHSFAKMLNENSIDYEYEPVRFNLVVDGVDTGYTPDFKINGQYYEIKNPYNVNDAMFKAKLIALSEQHHTDVVVLVGPTFSITDIKG